MPDEATPMPSGKRDDEFDSELSEEEMLDDESQGSPATPPSPADDDIDAALKPEPKPAPPSAADKAPGGLVHHAWAWQHRIEARWTAIGSGRFARVLKMAHKPEPDEFRQSATVVLVGIGIIGFIGFLVFLGMRLLLQVTA